MSQAGITISLAERNWEVFVQLIICLDTVQINEAGNNQY